MSRYSQAYWYKPNPEMGLKFKKQKIDSLDIYSQPPGLPTSFTFLKLTNRNHIHAHIHVHTHTNKHAPHLRLLE